MSLKVGDRIPHFELLNQHGELFKSETVLGVKPLVVYFYPKDETPGCTAEACSFRDHYAQLQQLHAHVFGLSVQANAYQIEAQQRLHLPFELLSDNQLTLKSALHLPTFEVASMELYKRITLILKQGRICKVFYPVFPSSENASEVLEWLKSQD